MMLPLLCMKWKHTVLPQYYVRVRILNLAAKNTPQSCSYEEWDVVYAYIGQVILPKVFF